MLLRGNDIQTWMHRHGGGRISVRNLRREDVPLEHGDILLAYTDGIVEPENVYGEVFGEDRLKDSYSSTLARIRRNHRAHNGSRGHWTGSSELQDDMTMVVARRI